MRIGDHLPDIGAIVGVRINKRRLLSVPKVTSHKVGIVAQLKGDDGVSIVHLE